MRTTATLFGLIFCVALASCAHQSNCECGSTTPVEEVAQTQPQPEATEQVAAAEAEERAEAPAATEVETQCPVVEVSSPTTTSESETSSTTSTSTPVSASSSTATLEVISIDASLVSISGSLVTIQDDRFAQLVLSCTGPEYTEVTINIVLRRAYVAPSLIQAGCKDFYFLTADGKRSQTFHWPQ